MSTTPESENVFDFLAKTTNEQFLKMTPQEQRIYIARLELMQQQRTERLRAIEESDNAQIEKNNQKLAELNRLKKQEEKKIAKLEKEIKKVEKKMKFKPWGVWSKPKNKQ